MQQTKKPDNIKFGGSDLEKIDTWRQELCHALGAELSRQQVIMMGMTFYMQRRNKRTKTGGENQ